MGDWFGAFGTQFLETVLPLLATAIAGLVVGILVRYFKKLGLDVTDTQQGQLKTIIEDAIRAAEEAARRAPTMMTSENKAALASEIILSQRPDLDPVSLSLAIDAALPAVRATGAIGAIPPLRQTPSTLALPRKGPSDAA